MRSFSWLFVSCLTFGGPGLVVAQEEMPAPSEAVPITIEELGASIQTEEGIWPRYFVIDSFFFWCADLDKMGGRWFEFNLGRDLGLERGSKAERALIKACHQAQELTASVWDAGAFVGRSDYEEKQWEFTRNKIERLAVFYREFLAEMVAHDMSLETLEWHFQNVAAPGTSLKVDANSSEARIDFLTKVIEAFDHAFRLAGE